jgi:hypothetical protein
MSGSKKANRYAPVLALILLSVAWVVVKQCNPNGTDPKPTTRKERTNNNTTAKQQGLNRQPSVINYSKHARCRMDCRHITQAEVKDILLNGTINYNKSDIGSNPDCRKKYAVEGKTNDGQRVRIIFAPCQDEVTVVTVIDLGKEWACDCD